jgi:hypothetical protein
MAEGLETADGERIDLDHVDQEFAAAMAAPPADDPEAPAPPDMPPVDPAAPYGRKLDGTPKKAPGGRPAKPRTTTAKAIGAGPQSGSQNKKTEPESGTYAKGLEELFAGVALALAVLPVPKDEVRIRLRVQAHVLKETGDGLAAGVGACAEHNGVVRWGVEKLTKGGGAWVFPAALAIAPFAVQTAALWRAPLEGDMREAADRIEEQALAEFKASMGMDAEQPGPEPEPAAA